MGIPELFKYSELLAIPLFCLIVYALMRDSGSYSISRNTISKSVLFLKGRKRMAFQLSFILKALLDLGFFLFVIDRFNLSWHTAVWWILLAEPLLFSSMAYFIVGPFTTIHRIVAYGTYLIWAYMEIYVANRIGIPVFTSLTYGSLIALIGTAIINIVLVRRSNAVEQIICMVLFYGWMGMFVLRYI